MKWLTGSGSDNSNSSSSSNEPKPEKKEKKSRWSRWKWWAESEQDIDAQIEEAVGEAYGDSIREENKSSYKSYLVFGVGILFGAVVAYVFKGSKNSERQPLLEQVV